MKKPKFKFLEQVFDKYGCEWVVVGITKSHDSIIYQCRADKGAVGVYTFNEHELYKTKKTG